MTEINIGKVKLTDEELQEFVRQCNGGLRLGTDENGNDGYYKYDLEAGADTFNPFRKSGGTEGGEVSSPYTHTVKFIGSICRTVATTLYSDFPVKQVKGLTLKKLNISIKQLTSGSNSLYIYFKIYGKKDGSIKEVKSYSVTATGTTNSTINRTDDMIDLTGYDSIDYVMVTGGGYSGSGYIYPYSIDAEFELTF